MKIAIPTQDKKTIASHFGRTKYLLIFDTNNKEKQFIENKHDEKLPAVSLKEQGVNEVIVTGIGYKALKLLDKFNIKVLKAEYEDIEENLKNIDKLRELSDKEGCQGEDHRED